MDGDTEIKKNVIPCSFCKKLQREYLMYRGGVCFKCNRGMLKGWMYSNITRGWKNPEKVKAQLLKIKKQRTTTYTALSKLSRIKLKKYSNHFR